MRWEIVTCLLYFNTHIRTQKKIPLNFGNEGNQMKDKQKIVQQNKNVKFSEQRSKGNVIAYLWASLTAFSAISTLTS